MARISIDSRALLYTKMKYVESYKTFYKKEDHWGLFLMKQLLRMLLIIQLNIVK